MTERICARCSRRLGVLSSARARPWRIEITEDGVLSVCYEPGPCKIAQLRKTN